MTTYYGNVRLKFDEAMLDSLIEMAGYGINYWADRAEFDEDEDTYTVHDFLESGTNVVTAEELADAMFAVARMDVQVAPYIVDYARSALLNDDPGDIDAELADVVVQVAIFGEIVYG